MWSSYGSLFCMIALYGSSVMGRPGPYSPRAFSNITSPSSTTTSDSITISLPGTVVNVTVIASPSSTSPFTTQSSTTSSPLTTPSSITISSIASTSNTGIGPTVSPFTDSPSSDSSLKGSVPNGCQPKTTQKFIGFTCVSYCQNEPVTSYAFDPSVTQTLTHFVTYAGNSTALNPTSQAPQPSQTLPPQPCFQFNVFLNITHPLGNSSVTPPSASTTLSYITSKTTVTTTVPPKSLGFGAPSIVGKVSVQHTAPTPTHPVSQIQPSQPGSRAQEHQPTINLPPTPPQSQHRVHSQGPVQSEVNPSPITTPNPGGAPIKGPAPTVVHGVSISIGSSVAIVGSSTFTIGPGSTPTTTVINGQTVSIGPSGVGIGGTTLYPENTPNPTPNPPTITQVATIGGVSLTEIGSTVVIGSQTFTLGPQATPTTVVINGQTFSLGPSGVGTPSTTVFIPSPQPTEVLTAAGLTLSEIGSSIVIIGSDTITLGGQVTPTTTTIDGVAISIGPGGVGIGGSTTITPPPPSAAPTTEAITAGGITFSEIGSTIVVIGGSTFTIGPGATPTTDIFDSITISIGPSGVGFPSTTVEYVGPTSTATGGGSAKSAGIVGVNSLWRSGSGMFGLAFCFCMTLWMALG